MRLAALISGGKDSICALTCALREHEVGELVNVQPVEDSLMYHVPCAHLTPLISQAVDIPLVSGVSSSHEDELVLLKELAARSRRRRDCSRYDSIELPDEPTQKAVRSASYGAIRAPLGQRG